MNLDEIIHRKPDEKVIYFLRRHWIIYAFDLLLISLLLVVPFVVYYAVANWWPQLLTGPVSRPLLILTGGAYLLLIWLFLLSSFVDFYLDAWIVTDWRVLNIEQKGLFSRVVSELDLAKIQDVTSEVEGFFPYIFNFGDVHIQTAGEVERFVFEQIWRPHEVRKSLLNLVETNRRRQGAAIIATAI